MAGAVFGTPINTQTLEQMPEYRNMKIRRSDKARVARDRMYAEQKYDKCQRSIETLSNEFGGGVKTLCTFYNATGDDLRYVVDHDWRGKFQNYPPVIKNGQWAGFLHMNNSEAGGSAAAIVYRGYNDDEVEMDWLLSWSTGGPWSNRVYTEIRQVGHYEKNNYWDELQRLLVANSSSVRKDENNECTSTTSIGTSCKAIMGLTNVPKA